MSEAYIVKRYAIAIIMIVVFTLAMIYFLYRWAEAEEEGDANARYFKATAAIMALGLFLEVIIFI